MPPAKNGTKAMTQARARSRAKCRVTPPVSEKFRRARSKGAMTRQHPEGGGAHGERRLERPPVEPAGPDEDDDRTGPGPEEGQRDGQEREVVVHDGREQPCEQDLLRQPTPRHQPDADKDSQRGSTRHRSRVAGRRNGAIGEHTFATMATKAFGPAGWPSRRASGDGRRQTPTETPTGGW